MDQEEAQWPDRDHVLGEDPGNINNHSNIRTICVRKRSKVVALLLNLLYI